MTSSAELNYDFSYQESLLSSLDSTTLSRHLKPEEPEEFPVVDKDGHTCGRGFLTLHCLDCGASRSVRTGSLDRTCPKCSKTLYRRMCRKYVNKVSRYSNLKFLTVTSRPVVRQSAEHVRWLFKCLDMLLHREPYCDIWISVLSVLEVKKTPEGLFYYHIHSILSGGYVKQAQISEDWCEISGNFIVDIRRVWRTKKKAVRYVLKYVAKGADYFNCEDIKDFKDSMFRVRFVHTHGDWYNIACADMLRGSSLCWECGSSNVVVFEFYRDSPINLREGYSAYEPVVNAQGHVPGHKYG